MSAAAQAGSRPRGPVERAGPLVALFALALGLRVAVVLWVGPPAGALEGSAWAWGHEAACLARSLVERGELADPWCQGTGSSAWLTPVFPALVALALILGGGVTPVAAISLQLAQALLSAATCPLLVVAGRRLELPRSGLLAGWLWALYPPALWHVARTVWDTTLVAFGVVAFLAVLSASGGSRRAAARSGLALGALILVGPAAAALAPAAVAWVLYRGQTPGRGARDALLLCLVAACVCLPWAVRNQLAVGTPGLRTNLGVALWLGNHERADGRPLAFREHPALAPREVERFRSLGEAAYERECAGRALEWIRSHPGDFARLTLRRAVHFWLGSPPAVGKRWQDRIEPVGDWDSWLEYAAFLGAALLGAGGLFVGRGAPSSRALLGLALGLYALPYSLTHVSARYRFPVDPLLVLLGACLLVRLAGRRRGTRA